MIRATRMLIMVKLSILKEGTELGGKGRA